MSIKSALGIVLHRRDVAALLLPLLLPLSSCSDHNVHRGDKAYPQQNQTPTKFLAMHGTIDPSLHIQFEIVWIPDNPLCDYTVNWLEGVESRYSAGGPLKVNQTGDDFFVRIPIDGVLPGRCQWRFGGVGISNKTNGNSMVIATNTGPLRPGQSPNGVANVRCSRPPGFFASLLNGQSMICRSSGSENPDAAVSDGILWWHPQATDFEIHISAY